MQIQGVSGAGLERENRKLGSNKGIEKRRGVVTCCHKAATGKLLQQTLHPHCCVFFGLKLTKVISVHKSSSVLIRVMHLKTLRTRPLIYTGPAWACLKK